MIPARGGSKRLPGKNIREFCGRPIIEYAIATALASDQFTTVVVSTDSEEIAAIATAAGAAAPFRRPAEIADDFTSTADVLTHALRTADPNHDAALACCVYPATPFLRAEDLVEGRACLDDADVDCAFAICAYDAPVERAFEVGAGARVAMRWPEFKDT